MAFTTSRKYLSLITEGVTGALEILFPHSCLGCGKTLLDDDGICFCKECREEITFIAEPFCPKCGIPFIAAGGSHLCGDCIKENPPFELARSMTKHEGNIALAIAAFKYGKNIGVGEALAEMFASHPFPGVDFSNFDLIVPAPLHKNRLRQRGFNQALLLAKALAKKHRIAMDFTSLIRKSDTVPQTSLDKKLRKKNIKGAFDIRNGEKLRGKSIILVDDVYTTGSTLKECSSTLRKGGAKTVIALTFSKAY